VNGAGSNDPDGSIASYAWSFGDNGTATGSTPTQHTYAADGHYTIALTVTDDQGLTNTTAHDVDVSAGSVVTSPIGFVGDATSSASTSTARLRVPTDVQAGDQLILIGSYAATGAKPSTPAGWALTSTRLNGPLESYLWTRRATATDAGATLTTATSSVIKSTLLLAAYRNVAATDGLADIASSTDSSTSHHTSPAVTAPTDGWVIQAWTDKSSGTTTWTPPTDVTTRASTFGTGGGRTTGLLTDSGTAVPAGPNGNKTAVTNSVSGRAVTWTLALKPAA
jgi:PKD repeat protein